MQFLVLGYDGKDKDALTRRLTARKQHVKLCDQMIASGNMLFGVAMLGDRGQMTGSTLICDFPSKQELENWLSSEPYVTGKVWEKIEIIPCKVGPSFISK